MKLKPLIVAMGFATVPLSGCGSDSDGEISKTKDPIPESAVTSDVYSIKAVDGYLRNAEVWLDINGNSLHDKNEPFAISKDGGVADLDVSGIDNPEQYSVMVKAIAGKTVDEDTVTETNKAGVPIAKPFVLSAPAGESIISPLSTLVQINMNNQMTKEEALAKVAQDLNIETSTILSDYVESNLGDVASKANAIVELGIVPESAEELKQDIQELENKLSEHVETIKQVVAGQLIIKDEDGKAVIVPNADKDDDGIIDAKDAFPDDSSEWLDTDSDGIGNNKDTDDDGDGVADADDVFPLDSTESVDTDSDGIGNNKDTDDDGDGVADVDDALPLDKTESVDTDGDSIGNNKDTDDDNDGIADADDVFPLDSTESVDTDSDGIGNNKDTDDDGDGVADVDDALPLDKTESVDTDGDSIGNNKDTDDDNDGIADADDVFPLDSTESVDTDSDGIGNNEDTDDDNDGVLDSNDAFPEDKSETLDTDGDGVGDNADAFPADKSETVDTDGDGVGDNADAFPDDKSETVDTDGDGVGDNADAFPADKSETLDTDGDGVGDNADAFPEDKSETLDTDGDGVGDNADAFPADKSETTDTDGDGVGDNADAFPEDKSETTDTDGDGVGDNADAFPEDKSETLDTDGDGVGDNADAFPEDKSETLDTDGDGVGDNADVFPDDKSETVDTDGDGVGDNADAFPEDKSETLDTDGDGVGDNADAFPEDKSETLDTDGDGVGDNADAFPADKSETLDTDGDGVGDNADAFPEDELETLDTDGDGVGDNADAFPEDKSETVDTDGDGVGDNADAFPADDSETTDTDGDGVGDNADAFPEDKSETVDTDGDGVGDNADAFPEDKSETTDTDGDGVGDNADAFPEDKSETLDTDGDGVGDNADAFPADDSETVDTDGDGVGDNADAFPKDKSETTDTDGDGVGDNADAFPEDKSETLDTDGDGVGDNADAFPADDSETVDTDGDGVGDNADAFPKDKSETTDTDGDGVGDNADAFPEDKSETVDTDGDGVGDNADAFPEDKSETVDTDGDGVGDNADAFPKDKSETTDTDGDGVGDNADAFPEDKSETVDTDGDGVGDNADAFPADDSETVDTDGDGVGDNADAFPEDKSETVDTDGDGVGDNADAFPADDSETVDTDGDGVGDNADAFPEDKSETADTDGDGVGDNADAFPADNSETVDTDSDGIGNNKDTDDDGDGVADSDDAFPLDNNESVDTDGDGIGNNADLDDDNDGYEDAVDTDPLVALTTPSTFGECLSSLPQAFAGTSSDLKDSSLYHVSEMPLDSEIPLNTLQLISEVGELNDWQGIPGLTVIQSTVDSYRADNSSLEVDPLLAQEYEYMGTGDNEGRYFGFQDIENRWYGLNLTNAGFNKSSALNETQTVISTRVTPWAPSIDDPQEISQDITYTGKEIIEGPDGPQEVCVQSYAYDLTYINKSEDESRKDLHITASGVNYIGNGEVLVKTVGEYTEANVDGSYIDGYTEQTKTLQGYTKGVETIGQSPVVFKSEMDLLREEYLEYNKDTDGDGIPDRLDEYPDNPFESVDTDKDGLANNVDPDDDNDGYDDIVDNEPLIALVTPDTYGQCLASLPQDQSDSNTDLKNSKLYQVIRTGLDSEYPSYFHQLITDQKVVDNWQETEGLSVNQSLVQLYDMSQLDDFSNPLVAEEYEYLGVGDEKGKYYGFQEINNQWYGLNLSTDGFSKLAKLNEPQQVESIRVTPWAPLKDDPQQVSEEITYVGKDIIQGPQGLQEVCVQSYNYDLTYINKSGDPGRADRNIKDSGTHYIGYGELLIKTVGNYTEYDLEGNPVWGFKEQTKSLLGYTSNNESFGSDISSFKADVELRLKEYEELTQTPIETGNNASDFLQENSTFIEYGIDGYNSSEKLTYLFDGSKLSVNKAELTNQSSLNYFAERDFNPTYILSADGTISVDSNSANIVDNGDGSVTYEQENQLYSDVISGKEVDLSRTNITYFLRSQKLYIPEMWDYTEQFSPGAKALISELAVSEYYYLESEHCYDNATVNGVIACNSIISYQEQQYVLSDLIVADFSQSGDQIESNNSLDYGFDIQGLLVQINEVGLVKLFDQAYDSETSTYTLNEIPLSADSAWQYTNNESMISLNIKLEDENAKYGWVNQYTIENINKTLVTELDGKLVKVKRSPANVEDTVFFNEIASNDIERVMAISDVNDTATACGDSITSSVDAISANYPSAYSEVIQQCNNLSDEFDLFASNYGKVLKVVSPRGDIHVISADSIATYSQNGAYVAPIGQAVDSVFEYQVTDLGRDGTYNIVVYSQVKLADGTYSYDVWSAIAKLSDSMANYCSIGNGSIASEDLYHNAVVSCTDPNLVSELVFHESYLNDKSLNIGGEDYSFSKNQIAVNSLGQEFSWHINDLGALQLEAIADSQRKIITLTDIYVSINSSGEDIVSLYSKELTINDFGELSYFVTSTGIEFN